MYYSRKTCPSDTVEVNRVERFRQIAFPSVEQINNLQMEPFYGKSN
jgi:hypothetical protein